MSRPRQPFGAQHPGRLPATMVKVLAAEMSDPSRLRRGKQYAKDGSVLDIMIEPGIVTCEVQGSRPTPYIAAVEVTAGNGMPLRRDITCTCTCPDDDNWDGHACKHVVAALFTLSNEFLLEPELLDLWRNTSGGAGALDRVARREDDTRNDATSREPGRRGHLRAVPDLDDDSDPSTAAAGSTAAPEPEVVVDPLADVLAVPSGSVLPAIPHLDDADLPSPKDRDLATALREALAHVRVDWD